MPVRSSKITKLCGPWPKMTKGILVWCPSLWMKESRSKEKHLLKCCIIKYLFKTKLPLSIEYCHMPYFYSPFCLPHVLHTQTHRHTPLWNSVITSKTFLVSLVCWGVSKKQVLVIEKPKKKGKIIGLLKLNHNS